VLCYCQISPPRSRPGRDSKDHEIAASGNTLILTPWQRLTSRQVVLHHREIGQKVLTHRILALGRPVLAGREKREKLQLSSAQSSRSGVDGTFKVKRRNRKRMPQYTNTGTSITNLPRPHATDVTTKTRPFIRSTFQRSRSRQALVQKAFPFHPSGILRFDPMARVPGSSPRSDV
jgi:hypothetical protein